MKKKLTALSLAFAIIIILAACGSTTPNGTVTGQAATPTGTVSETSVEASVEVSAEPSVEASTEESTEPVQEETEEEVPVYDVVGLNQGLVYENEYFGIGCALGDDWNLYSQEEVEEINKQTATLLSDDYAKLLENAASITDMYAMNVNGVDTMNVGIQKLSKLEALAVTEQANLEAAVPMIKEAFAQMGLTDMTTEIHTTTIAGVEHPVLWFGGMMGEYPVYEQLFCIKNGSYLASITVCSWLEDDTDDYLALFYELN